MKDLAGTAGESVGLHSGHCCPESGRCFAGVQERALVLGRHLLKYSEDRVLLSLNNSSVLQGKPPTGRSREKEQTQRQHRRSVQDPWGAGVLGPERGSPGAKNLEAVSAGAGASAGGCG